MGGVTWGTLMGGRVRYAQPAEGFRSGIEPVLLGAAVPARQGERVLEAGSGAGAGLLCLAHRTGTGGVGVELDPALAEIAAGNAAANGFEGLRFVAADIGQWMCDARYDHAFANPPYHPPHLPASPDARRDRAKRAAPMLLEAWTAALARRVTEGGSVTLVLPAGQLGDVLAAYARHRLGSVVIYPLWPREGRAAKLVLVQGRVGGRGAPVLAAGLVLHAAGGFTAQADAVLRGAAALRLRA
ncbi:MAG TPA: methyltransferase domain-containing protein [Acidisphaera sp.]|nr:methyltransferase domain-containing protein [Acidisphaera sp.]